MLDKGNTVRNWRIIIRGEFIRLCRQGIFKDSFGILELSEILGESEDLIHNYLKLTTSSYFTYHAKDKVLYLDPFNNQFIVYKNGKKCRGDG